MARLPILILCCLLVISLFCAAGVFQSHRLSSDSGAGRAAAALAPRITDEGTPLPSSLLQEVRMAQQAANMQLQLPSAWSAPSVRSLLQIVRGDSKGRELYARSGSTRPPADALAGSYAVLRPNEIGEEGDNPRLSGSLNCYLRRGYSRAQQQAQNIALIYCPRECTGGAFSLRFDSPGWYLITLHLANAGGTTSRICTKAALLQGWSAQVVIDDDRQVAGGASFVLPCLVEVTAAATRSLFLEVSAPDGAHIIAFQSITVDEL
jgi:hypothetical protein